MLQALEGVVDTFFYAFPVNIENRVVSSGNTPANIVVEIVFELPDFFYVRGGEKQACGVQTIDIVIQDRLRQ